jgi:hypothetical protein
VLLLVYSRGVLNVACCSHSSPAFSFKIICSFFCNVFCRLQFLWANAVVYYRNSRAVLSWYAYVIVCLQWIIPTVNNSMVPFKELHFSAMVERLIKLAVSRVSGTEAGGKISTGAFFWFAMKCLNFELHRPLLKPDEF